jgi:hypothetical protein
MQLFDLLAQHDDDYRGLHQAFAAKGLQVSYDPPKAGPARRVIISAKSKEYNPLMSEANGLIATLTEGKWEPLVIPPRRPRTFIDRKFVAANFKKYDIYHMDDGTSINLYWWAPEERWCISTVKGYDMGNVKWMGRTYMDVFTEVLTATGRDPDGFFASLDKGHSYSLGFSHPDFHPWQNAHGLWFIQQANLSTMETVPCQIDVPAQRRVKATSLGKLLATLPPALQKYLDGERPPILGYVLRAKEDMPLEHAHILLESSLFREIRSVVYDGLHTQAAREFEYDRQAYIIINAFLTQPISKRFCKLMPRFKAEYDKLLVITKRLVQAVAARYKAAEGDRIADAKVRSLRPEYANASNYIMQEIGKKRALSVKNPTYMHTIASFVLDPSMLHVFHTLYKTPVAV